MYPVLAERSSVSCSLIMWSWLILCSATADLSVCASHICLLCSSQSHPDYSSCLHCLWRWNRRCSETLARKIQTPGITQKKAYKNDSFCYCHDVLYTGCHLLCVSFITSLKSNVCWLWPHTTLQKITILSDMQKIMTTHRPNVILTGVHWVPATDNEESAFLGANNRWGHLQTARTASVRAPCHKGTRGW
jgi:hypothetical protein